MERLMMEDRGLENKNIIYYGFSIEKQTIILNPQSSILNHFSQEHL